VAPPVVHSAGMCLGSPDPPSAGQNLAVQRRLTKRVTTQLRRRSSRCAPMVDHERTFGYDLRWQRARVAAEI